MAECSIETIVCMHGQAPTMLEPMRRPCHIAGAANDFTNRRSGCPALGAVAFQVVAISLPRPKVAGGKSAIYEWILSIRTSVLAPRLTARSRPALSRRYTVERLPPMSTAAWRGGTPMG